MPATASALALVLALSSAAAAQDQATQQEQTPGPAQDQAPGRKPPPPELQEVVVTGIRKSLESAQAIKQNSEQIVDSVTAQDIGALPDRSVSEALQRIPGITLQRTDSAQDPQRLSSEGGGIFIRGLSWVRSELNGRDVFSASDGRAIGFEDVSSDLLAGIDVYKNPEADMIEGGIGGVVNLRTRLPFDSHKQIIAVSGDYNYADLLEKGFYSGNALYSNTWDTGIGRVGALFSGSIGNIGNRTDSIQLGNYVPQTLTTAVGSDPAGSSVLVPNGIGFSRIDWAQRRIALSGALQWEPSDKWLMTLEAFQAKSNPHFLQYDAADAGYYLGNSAANYTNVAAGIVTAGVVPTQPQLFTRYDLQHHTTDDFSINLKFEPTDRLKFSGDVQYIKSHSDTIDLSAYTEEGGYNCDGSGANGNYATITLANGSTCSSSTGGYSQSGTPLTSSMNFNIGGKNPSLVLNQSQAATANNYWWYAAMDHLEDNDAHSWAQRLDGDFKFEQNDWLDSFRFGVRATDKQAITRETGWNWALLSHAFWGGGTAAYINQSPTSATQYVTFPNFMRGNVPAPGSGWFPSQQLVTNGTAYAYSLLQSTETAGTGAWTPLSSDFSNATAGADNPLSGVNNQGEHTYASYLLLKFRHNDTPLGRMDGNIGLRIVHTDESSGMGYMSPGAAPAATAISTCVNQYGTAACQYVIDATTFDAGGKQSLVFPNNTYTDVLPTLNVRFLLKEDLQLRFAFGKAMVRPTFSQLNGFTVLGHNFAPDGIDPAIQNPLTGAGGNPELKPTRANQFDTSLEWYFAPTGSLTFGLFYKDVHDYIFTGNETETYTSNGVTQSFQVTRNLNGDRGKIQGFELGYQQFYDFLPRVLHGFGLSGNLTFVDSHGGNNTVPDTLNATEVTAAANPALPLEGLSRWSYNAGALYEAHRVSARLAWNWRERYLLTTSAANLNAPVWSENYGQLDAEAFYTLTGHVKIGLQGTNLLKARTYLDIGTAALAPRYSWTATDTRYALAVRAQF